MTIMYKYKLSVETQESEIVIPHFFTPLHFEVDNCIDPCLWGTVISPENTSKCLLPYIIVGTGEHFDGSKYHKYIGTIKINGCMFFHLFLGDPKPMN